MDNMLIVLNSCLLGLVLYSLISTLTSAEELKTRKEFNMNWHNDFLEVWTEALLHSTRTGSAVPITQLYCTHGVLLGTLDESTPRVGGRMIFDYFDNLIKKTPVAVEWEKDIIPQYLDDNSCLISGYYTFVLDGDVRLKAKYSFHVSMISEGNYKILLHNSGRRNS